MNYFERLLNLLKIEREADRKAYLQLTESTSTTDRRAKGLTWYPIAIKGTEPSRGDYITVEAERTTHQDIAHQLRFGALAALFSNHDPKNNKVEGTITYQSGNRLKITLRTDELPDWSRDGKLGIDLLFDDNSYDEMQSALKQALTLSQKPNDSRLIQVLTGQTAPYFLPETYSPALPNLNNSQNEAIRKILASEDIAIVHGPPGTGKTTTLVQAVVTLIKQNKKQLLVVASSNTAVDLLSEKLSNEGLNVLRIGNPARVSERLMDLTLDSKMAEHSYIKEVKNLKKQAAEYKNMAHKYKRNFGKAERDQRKALFDEAHKIMKEVGKTEQYIIDDLVAKAQIITATLVGANYYTIRNLKFDTVIIDEAGQALEPACWIPILKANKVIMAGDHQQLSPIVKSAEAAQNGLSTTLLEKCVAWHQEAVTLLDEQYRMNTAIMKFSSIKFYENRLHAHPSVAHQLILPNDLPVTYIDTAGCGFEEKLEGTSSTNPEEAAFLCQHMEKLVAELQTLYTTENFPSIGVISPYREQIRLLNEQVVTSAELQPYQAYISVNTIDSFQGQERDVIYISMVRSNNEGTVGFLSDIRRMNVAMTRAKKKLIVIGDSSTLSQFGFYADFINYAEQIGGYKSAWEYLHN